MASNFQDIDLHATPLHNLNDASHNINYQPSSKNYLGTMKNGQVYSTVGHLQFESDFNGETKVELEPVATQSKESTKNSNSNITNTLASPLTPPQSTDGFGDDFVINPEKINLANGMAKEPVDPLGNVDHEDPPKYDKFTHKSKSKTHPNEAIVKPYSVNSSSKEEIANKLSPPPPAHKTHSRTENHQSPDKQDDNALSNKISEPEDHPHSTSPTAENNTKPGFEHVFASKFLNATSVLPNYYYPTANNSKPAGPVSSNIINMAAGPKNSASFDPQVAIINSNSETLSRQPNGILPASSSSEGAIMRDAPPYIRGDLIVTVNPEKRACIWLTPATFDSNKVPSEFLDPKLSVTADDFSLALKLLTNDYRFTCYNMCYKRIIVTWLLFGFLILVAILFSGLTGPVLFGMGIIWLLVNTIGIFMCLLIKKKMNYNLEDAVATVNRILVKKNVLVGMEDKGKMSCHKIMLHFIYYDIEDCVAEMVQLLEKKQLHKKSTDVNLVKLAKLLDIHHRQPDLESIVEGGSATNYKLNYYQAYAEKLLLRSSQSYVRNLTRGRLTIPHPELPQSKTVRHVKRNFCLCQYVEDYYFLGKERKWYNVLL